jgi:hypothetical protein
LIRTGYRGCAHRIEHNIEAKLQQVALPLNEDSFEPALKDMAYFAITPIVALGVESV